eukprot:CAMPEP_0114687124 /NCGR_PEP_ID=MMETSP0191-20121206/62175_1 /TAXON_ID=126664 /ORGANISM="Sorites sp." /LENGTH=228 /DNA_ID=CAMNT_0001973315 /DNA_START=68 /DNA_END=754 /DNA_ORIENTATION=+
MRCSFTTPLATLSASFITWYLMEQRPVPTDGSVTSLLPTLADSVPFRVCRRSDEFQELYAAGSRVLLMLQDMAMFVCSEVGRRVLPWPLEIVQGKASQLWEEVYVRVNQVMEAYEACRSFTADVAAQLLPYLEGPRQSLQGVTSRLEEVIQRFVDSFLEAYPQHRSSLAGLHPVLLLFHLTFLILGLCQLLYTFASLVSLIFSCCRTRKTKKTPKSVPEASPSTKPSA